MAKFKKFVQNNNNYAIAYYRYSSHNQNEMSIEQQQEAAKRYAEEHGYQIIAEYADKAMTGTDANRPEFTRMLQEVEELKPAVLILWKGDRLARNRTIALFAKQALREAGCKPVYIAEALPEDDDSADFMEGLFELMAEDYSKRLSTSVRRGIKYNAENALYNGRTIIGYKAGPDKKYIADPDTAPIVQRIFRDYANGKTLSNIVKELNAEGIKTIQGNDFTINGLRRILHNRAYIGEYHCSGITVPDGMPALVDMETFEKVQAEFAKNQRLSGQKKQVVEENNVDYWLSGRIYCGMCGGLMTGMSGRARNQEKYYYYACYARRKRKCKKKHIRKEKIEKIICKMISDLLNDESLLLSLSMICYELYMERFDSGEYLDILKTTLRDVEKKQRNIMRAIEDGAPYATMKKRMEELAEQEKSLKEAIRKEELKQKMQIDTMTVYKLLRTYRYSDLNDPKLRNKLFDLLVSKIYLFDDKLVVSFTFTDEPREILLDQPDPDNDPDDTHIKTIMDILNNPGDPDTPFPLDMEDWLTLPEDSSDCFASPAPSPTKKKRSALADRFFYTLYKMLA